MKKSLAVLGLAVIGLAVLRSLSSSSAFAVTPDYGPEYFYAIGGEVSGQAAPGVQAVYVNSSKVRLNRDMTFTTNVTLKTGEKYLIIDTRYKNLQFIKKYLVVRHPKAQKTFKITVPKQEFEQIIAHPEPKTKIHKEKTKKKIKTRKKIKALSKTPAKSRPKIKPDISDKWLGYELVQQLGPKKYFVVRKIDDKYFALIYLQKTKEWIPFNDISAEAFFDILRQSPKTTAEAKNKL